MRSVVAAIGAGLLLLLLCPPQVLVRAQESPSKSVFSVAVIEYANEGPYRSQYRSVYSGTAFFIASDGTALTNSHVVYPVRASQAQYRLLAIVGNEFYGATLICMSALPEDPQAKHPEGVMLSRDIAEIRVTLPQFPFDELGYGGIAYARAHHGPLPAFPVLTLGTDPNVGDTVRVLGFGRNTSPLPYEWSAEGTVITLRTTPDGTPVFGISFTREAEPGHSGSPVLDTEDRVVGIYTWHNMSDHTWGTAISRSALEPACPSPSGMQVPIQR
jgi:V8-like Glu-specific endopeptidase